MHLVYIFWFSILTFIFSLNIAVFGKRKVPKLTKVFFYINEYKVTHLKISVSLFLSGGLGLLKLVQVVVVVDLSLGGSFVTSDA